MRKLKFKNKEDNARYQITFLNLETIEEQGVEKVIEEGCLSFPKQFIKISR